MAVWKGQKSEVDGWTYHGGSSGSVRGMKEESSTKAQISMGMGDK